MQHLEFDFLRSDIMQHLKLDFLSLHYIFWSYWSSGLSCLLRPWKYILEVIKVIGSPNYPASCVFQRVYALKKAFSPPCEVHVQVTCSLPLKKIEIFKSLEEWVENNILILLKLVKINWWPHDFLLDPYSKGFIGEANELREWAPRPLLKGILWWSGWTERMG